MKLVIIIAIILLNSSDSFRLPNNSIPLTYTLRVKTDIHKNELKFDGSVYVRIKILEPSNAITLHSRNLTITFIDLYNQNNSLTAQNLNYTLEASLDLLTIRLPSNYSENTELIVAIFYTGTLSDSAIGFYHTFYMNDSFEPIPLAATHFEPTNARSAFPCYDEPQMRAVFRLEIMHDKSYKAVSNMPPIAVDPRESSYFVTKFEETPPISTCSLAFVVSNLASISNNKKFNQTIVGQPEKIARGEGDFAMKIAEEISEKYFEIFGRLPISKVDHFGIPNTDQHLDNLGLMTYEEDFLLLNLNFNQNIVDYFKPQIIATISHNYAAQYFGNIVSPAWWKHLWLDKGIATFLQFHIANLLYPEHNFIERFRNEVMQFAFDFDSELNSITMNDNAESSLEIYEKFNPITFAKAAVVVRMFHEALSPSTFEKGLRHYLHEMNLTAVAPVDLHRALQRALEEDQPLSNVNIGELMETWECQAGYPLISVMRDGRNIILTQTRFLNESSDQLYAVPITYATKSEMDFTSTTVKTWMTTKTLTLPNVLTTANDWFVMNIQQVGYYRVDYSRDIWNDIIIGYKENYANFHRVNRELLHEEMFMAWKVMGTMTANDCLALLGVLEYENTGSVWECAQSYMENLNNFLMFSDVYAYFQNFLRDILRPHINILISNETNVDVKLQSAVRKWSKVALDEIYLQQELQKLIQFMRTNEADDNVDFCSAFRTANESIYSHFMEELKKDMFDINFGVINGLGCSLNAQLLRGFLNEIINSPSGLIDFIILNAFYTTMESSEIGLETLMEFFESNYMSVERKFPGEGQEIVISMHLLINSDTHFESYRKLTNKLVASGEMQREGVNQLLRNIQEKLDNEEWHNVREWFEEREQEMTTVTTSSTVETTTSETSTIMLSIAVVRICITFYGVSVVNRVVRGIF